MKYYLEKRPPLDGNYPKYKDNKVIKVVDYKERRTVVIKETSGLKRIYAYGYVSYQRKISALDQEAYEMVRAVQ